MSTSHRRDCPAAGEHLPVAPLEDQEDHAGLEHTRAGLGPEDGVQIRVQDKDEDRDGAKGEGKLEREGEETRQPRTALGSEDPTASEEDEATGEDVEEGRREQPCRRGCELGLVRHRREDLVHTHR